MIASNASSCSFGSWMSTAFLISVTSGGSGALVWAAAAGARSSSPANTAKACSLSPIIYQIPPVWRIGPVGLQLGRRRRSVLFQCQRDHVLDLLVNFASVGGF